ncbi:MAG: DEAD/DEAH box helicase [Planctomycetes bacterium]|nr:DEAD/DEAH box helicase [Planctomycetota bacterium]
MIQGARQALRTENSILLQAPTGAGKTVLASTMLGRASKKGLRAFFICHRAELIDQTARTFDEVGIPYGFIASGMRPDPFQPVQICSIQTLVKRYQRVQRPDLCVWDECHHLGARSWARAHDYYSDAKHVGLTATPERLDGKGLKAQFSEMVKGPSVAWLIEHGYLADYKVYAPSRPDLSGVHTKMGDYARNELATTMDDKTITGDAMAHYQRLTPGKRAIVFCVSIKHSQHVAEQFKAAGIEATHIDGKMGKVERKAAISDFRSGRTKVLCNVEIVGEGFDLPAIEAAILLRPTQSTALYLQQVGRTLRVKPDGAKAVILDHAGNVMRHGLPDEERDWTLEGHKRKGRRKEQEQSVFITQCPKCYFVFKPAPVCPECGHRHIPVGRMPDTKDGELVEVDKDALKRRRRRERSNATTYEDLVALGQERDYKAPHTWARYIIAAREKKLKRIMSRRFA